MEPHILSATLAVLMAGQAVLGLAFPDLYRDTGFVRETWFVQHAFSMLGAALNAYLPLYVGAFLLAAVALTLSLSHVDVGEVGRRFHPKTPTRLVGGYLIFVAAALTVISAIAGLQAVRRWCFCSQTPKAMS